MTGNVGLRQVLRIGLLCVFSAYSATALAQIPNPLYYDRNGTDAGLGAQGAAGVWDDATSNWNNGDAVQTEFSVTPWANGNTAIFLGDNANPGNVVRVDRTSVSALSIRVQTNGYLFRIPTATTRVFTGNWVLGLTPNTPVAVGFDGRTSDGSTSTAARTITIDSILNETGVSGSSVNLETYSSGNNVFRVNLANNGSIQVPLTISGTGAANLVGISNATISGNITGNGAALHLGATSGNSLSVNAAVNNGTGNVHFGVGAPAGGGGGVVILGSGAKTWQDTVINLANSGTVRMNALNALPTGTNVIFNTNATLELSGRNTTIGGLTSGLGNGNIRNQSATAALLTISGGVTSAFAGSISDGVGGGALSLTRSGSGSTTLSGTNTYTGSTTVSGGALVIDGTHTGGAAATVSGGQMTVTVNGSFAATNTSVTGGILKVDGTYNNSGTFSVSAPGTVSGNGTINTSNVSVFGTISPGASIGSLAINGNLTLAAGSTVEYELQTNGLDGDLIHVDGNLSITAGSLLTLSDLDANIPVLVGSKLTMISYTGTWDGGLFTFGGNQLANNQVFEVSGQEWQIRYNDNAGGTNFVANQNGANGFLTLTAVPEPSALLIVGAVIGVAFARRRR